MPLDQHDPRPIYIQIAEEIKESIATGQLKPGDRVPSTNEISTFYTVNPTTAAKALSQLHEAELVTKKRGLGMFVNESAKDLVIAERQRRFASDYIQPLIRAARSLGMSKDRIHQLLDKEMKP